MEPWNPCETTTVNWNIHILWLFLVEKLFIFPEYNVAAGKSYFYSI